jgi:archaellum biogenesis ATPase FlaH
MKEIEIQHKHIAQSAALGMDINEYMSYQSTRIIAMQKENIELEERIHRLSLNILINNPIFENPIKL